MNNQSQPASTAPQPSFGKDDSKVQKLAVLLFRLKCFKDSRLLCLSPSLFPVSPSLSLSLSVSPSLPLPLCLSIHTLHMHTLTVMHMCTCAHIHTHLYELLEHNFCRHEKNVFIPHYDSVECTQIHNVTFMAFFNYHAA